MTLRENFNDIKTMNEDMPHYYELFFNEITKQNADVVVELGVRSGISTMAFMYAVECTGGFLYSYDKDIIESADPHHLCIYERLGKDVEYLYRRIWRFKLGNSLVVHEDFRDNECDVVFIDTDHNKEQIYNELSLWYPKLQHTGCFLMHDVIHPSFNIKEGINKFLFEHPELHYDEFSYTDTGIGRITRNEFSS